MADDGTYKAFVARLLTRPRKDYSIDIAQYLSNGHSQHADNYQAGLIFLACIIGGFATMWFLIIFILKLKGPSVGCASGHAFERIAVELHNAESTDLESNGSSDEDEKRHVGTKTDNHHHHHLEDFSMQSSLPSVDSEEHSDECESDDAHEHDPPTPTTRERRTQLCFLLVGIITLLCIPVILIVSFAPLKQASKDAAVHLDSAHAVIAQVETSYVAVSLAANASVNNAAQMSFNFSDICPGYSAGQSTVDLESMVGTLSTSYTSLHDGLSASLAQVKQALDGTEFALASADLYNTKIQRYLWLVPAFLFLLGGLVTVALVGAVVAWRGKSTRKLQRLLFYGVLPFLVLCSFGCWATAISLGITTAMGGDGCLYDSLTSGSPAAMIEAIVHDTGVGDTSFVYSYVAAYTDGCKSGEPTLGLYRAETTLDSIANAVDGHISVINSTERANLVQMCGGDKLYSFLLGASDQAKLLTIASQAIQSAAQALSCTTVQPIYAHLVNKSICSDSMGAVAWSFLMFLLLGVTTAILITLRASWTQPIQEQKIFAEKEVAENMIVNEHEEYLAYISKYKHEWQEYSGIDSALPDVPGLTDAVGSHSLGSMGEPTEDQSVDADSAVQTECHELKDAFDPYTISESQSVSTIGDVSFPSLRSHQESNKQRHSTPDHLLPCTTNSEDDADELLANDDSQRPPADTSTLIARSFRSDCEGKVQNDAPKARNEVAGLVGLRSQRKPSEVTKKWDAPPSCTQPKQEVIRAKPSPKRKPFPDRAASSPKVAVNDTSTSRSERMLLEMEEIGAIGPVDLAASNPSGSKPQTSASTERSTATPPLAVTKMIQQKPPAAAARYGTSVRTSFASSRRGAKRSTSSPRNRELSPTRHHLPSPSSYSPPDSKSIGVDQYPKVSPLAESYSDDK